MTKLQLTESLMQSIPRLGMQPTHILFLVRATQGPLTAAQASDISSLHIRTAQRALHRLEQDNYLTAKEIREGKTLYLEYTLTPKAQTFIASLYQEK